MSRNILEGLFTIAIVGLVLTRANQFASVVTAGSHSYQTLVSGLQGVGYGSGPR